MQTAGSASRRSCEYLKWSCSSFGASDFFTLGIHGEHCEGCWNRLQCDVRFEGDYDRVVNRKYRGRGHNRKIFLYYREYSLRMFFYVPRVWNRNTLKVSRPNFFLTLCFLGTTKLKLIWTSWMSCRPVSSHCDTLRGILDCFPSGSSESELHYPKYSEGTVDRSLLPCLIFSNFDSVGKARCCMPVCFSLLYAVFVF